VALVFVKIYPSFSEEETNMQKTNALKEAVLFFALTIGLSYFVFWGPIAVFQIPTISFVSDITGPVWAILLFMLGGFVPSLVAVLLTWQREGVSGLKQLGRRGIQFKIGGRWYLAMVALVILATLGQILIIQILGYSFDFYLFLVQAGSFLPLIIIGPISEEFGWRGYALDRLQSRFSPLISSIMIGIVWGLWHAPLFMMVGTSQHELGIPFAGFTVGLIALSILFTWLHNNTGGSIWTAIFFHWIYTYMAQVVASGVARSPVYNWIEFLPYVIEAIIIVAVWSPRSRPETQPAG
jgi:membrane protease YdiL (CAAX protease family)